MARKNYSNEICSNVHPYATRNRNNIFINHYCRGNIKNRSILIYNKLPDSVKSNKSKYGFKSAL